MLEHTSWLTPHYQENLGPVIDTLQPPTNRAAWRQISEHFFISIHQFDPTCWAYATNFMSAENDREKLELHFMTPPNPEHHSQVIDILAASAYYHRLTRPLGLHHTISFGIPLAFGSSLNQGFVSLPYLRGPELEWHTESNTQCLWLIPISQSERDFKKAQGVEALELLFEENNLNYLSPGRASLV